MGASQKPNRETLLDIYRRVYVCRANDERFHAVIKSGKMVTNYYSARGQEVIPASVSACLSDDDYVITIYRGIHDMLAKGVPMKELWAEVAGKATGSCKGKGGPMHITHPDSGVSVTTGIVGSGLPIANGLAWASQIKGDGRVTVAYFGDGASNIGAFHEALNMAAVWKLPVVFVCQNNGYAEHTRYELGTSVENIADRAVAYRIPGVTVNGNDPVAMWGAAREAIDRARAGNGPTLLEAKTFRFMGHNLGDDNHYMLPGELDAAMAKDPVPAFRAMLIAEGHASEAELKALEAAVEKEIDEAVEFALSSPYPDLAELRRDVFATEVAA